MAQSKGHGLQQRLVSDPNFDSAEFDLLVRSDLKRRGIGRRLLAELLDYARSRSIGRVAGEVLVNNGAMIDLARHLGAVVVGSPSDAGTLQYTSPGGTL